MKKLATALGLLLTCIALLALPVYAQTTPQPIGIIALKVTGVPAGTPTGSQLGWTANPTCSVVSSTGTYGYAAVEYAVQRKIFYANGRFWVFYYDGGSSAGYSTSTDGFSWTPFTSFTSKTCGAGWRFAVAFNGSYLHYVLSTGTDGDPLYYRAGIPNSDGTITWLDVEQNVTTGETNTGHLWPSIAIDSAGYPWIAYARKNVTENSRYAYITTSSWNNGTWKTATGFPYKFSPYNYTGINTLVVPLTNRKVLAIGSNEGWQIMAYRWDGSSWGAEANTTSIANHEIFLSAVNQGDNVHLVFLQNDTRNLVYTKYEYSSNSWGTETIIQSAVNETSSPVLTIDTTTNNLYCFWAANSIYYKKYDGASWSFEADSNPWITETSLAGYYNYDGISGFYQAYNNKVGLAYTNGTSTDGYYVKFRFLNINRWVNDTWAVNLRQSLSVDQSTTLQADTTVGALSNVYGLDYTVYQVDAYNDTLNHKAAGLMNLTLGNHYIPNEAWVTAITVTVYGNASRLCNTLANWYIYNYTAGAYITMGLLNSTTRASLTYIVPAAYSTVIDETASNSIMLKYNYTDTTNVDYLLDIDYIKIDVTYQFNITVSNWTATQTEKTVGVSTTYEHTDTFTLACPSGVTDHNFTLYYETPNYPLITYYGIAPTAKVAGNAVTVTAPITINITNLVLNTTEITTILPKVHIVKPPSDVVYANVNFQGGINKLAFTITGTGTKTIQIFIPSAPYMVIMDNQPLPTTNYTWADGILNVTVTLSTHTLEIYQYNPSPAPAPTPTPTPTPTPSPYTITTPAGAIPTWIIPLIILAIAAIGYAVLRRH